MRFQSSDGGNAASFANNGLENASESTKSTALPFSNPISLASISGPTYLNTQTLAQQVAYALSDRVFTSSPETFHLDLAARQWSSAKEQNAHGAVPAVQNLATRSGAGAVALGYMFSADFDLQRRHVPQGFVASAAALDGLRSTLDQLSLLYDVANPTALQVAAVDYDASSRAGLVSDYCSSLALTDELGLGLVASKSVFEAQHMALLATLMASVLPTVHTYDGVVAGRETTRVVDVLNVKSLRKTYGAVLDAAKEDLSSKRLTPEGKIAKLLDTFNGELGTEYKPFEYQGHASPTSVMVVFGSVEASLSAQVADALATQGVKVGVVNVRVYRPFLDEEFLKVLPETTRQVTILGQVHDQVSVADPSVTSALYADVMAAINFQGFGSTKAPSVYDIKYARETVWTVTKVSSLLRQLGADGEAVDQRPALVLTGDDTKQYSFWDLDAAESASAPVMVSQLLADDSSVNVAVRSGYDNLVQGGSVRTDIRCSVKSIDAPYSVRDADVIVVGSDKLLKEFAAADGAREGGIVVLQSEGWKDEDVEKKLSVSVRKTLAARKLSLFVLDPTASPKVVEDAELQTYLLQLAFLKLARPDVYASGVKKLSAAGDVLEALAQDLEVALKQVQVEDTWLAVEEENQSAPLPEDLNVNSFVSFSTTEEEAPTALTSWTSVAKGLAFKEAYGTQSALRPDLAIKTAVVTVKEHRRLTPESYDRNIFHIEFDLGDSGLKYEIGEALGIHAENDHGEVQQFIEWYGLDAGHVVEVPSREDPRVLESRTVFQALTQNIDIFGRPPKRFYEALAEFASEEKERIELLMLGTGGNQEAMVELKRRAEVDTITYADLLLEFPSARPGFHDIVRMVNPMKRREYSVASSQKVTPTSIALCIVTVNWVDTQKRDRFGQATRYLNALPVGSPVTVSIKPSVMKLPPKTTQPIIMAGLGTGLAPFRAFVQERAFQRSQGHPIGDVFLYMGARHQREEYLYGEEWEAYQDAGVITLLGRAFSRDQPQKIYIQDRMRQTLGDIRRAYLRSEGAFYLCGPTWPVPDVQAVLEEAVEIESAADVARDGKGKKKDGRKEIERLKEEMRYVLEVY